MSVSPAGAAFVRDLVYRRSAIVLEEDKLYLIETRLDPLAVETGFATIDAMVDAARGLGPALLKARIVEALTTNETFFFRDLWPFECLRLALLPALIAARAGVRELTIWSAACSFGQEPYSIAMVIREHFPELAGWRIRILATDLAEHALTRARAARYRQMEVNRGLPAALLVKYFDRVGTDWVVKDEIREMVTFSQMNLIDAWTMSPKPDVIFLRNVLIYFDNATKRTILARVRTMIAPDGALLLGAAETTINVDDRWLRVPMAKSAYYQRGTSP